MKKHILSLTRNLRPGRVWSVLPGKALFMPVYN